MAKQFPTQCKAPGCGNLTHYTYCEEHTERESFDRKQRASAAQRGYDARWQRYRKYFISRHPLCAECGRMGEVVDHIIPHKGSRALFWDESNHQTLCISCHNSKTASEEMDSWNTFKGLR